MIGIIKDDINFLDYPNWAVGLKEQITNLNIKKDNGFYEIKCPEGLPGRFDKLVLYFLLHQLSQQASTTSHTVVTTRYEIAKSILFQEKNFSKEKYDRIMLALKRWKAIYIRYEGVFFDRDLSPCAIRYFSIIDYVSLDKKTNDLIIKFNDHYIMQLRNTNFYRLIDFYEYKKLIRPVSARLYEILVIYLYYQDLWCIDVMLLGEKLTLKKRFFASHILNAIEPAIKELNENTKLLFSFDYDKERSLCIFKKNIGIKLSLLFFFQINYF